MIGYSSECIAKAIYGSRRNPAHPVCAMHIFISFNRAFAIILPWLLAVKVEAIARSEIGDTQPVRQLAANDRDGQGPTSPAVVARGRDQPVAM